jgi:hypothetical protein
MRRRLIFVVLPLAGLAAWLLRQPLESQIKALVARRAARHTLTGWGLVPTPENMRLYQALGQLPPPPDNDPPDFCDSAHPPPPIPAPQRFSARWTYGQLAHSGRITIGVYHVDPVVSRRLDSIARACAEQTHGRISLSVLTTRDELVRSFAEDSIVLYFGHANAGRGIRFADETTEPPLPMAPEFLDVPRWSLTPHDTVLEDLGDGRMRIQGGNHRLRDLNVQCKVFAYFGCRTDVYFREIWAEQFPRVDFIGTAYVCDASAMAPDLLAKLVHGLLAGGSLPDIVESLNQNRSAAILFGRAKEVAHYHNPTNHPSVLFTVR